MATHSDVYVISDLHIGGRPAEGDKPSFQMCPPEARRRAARFVRKITSPGRGKQVELVINGDFVDFLAEEPFSAFTADQDEAVKKFKQIIEHCDGGHPKEEQLFLALRDFLAAGHSLVLLLGNHDIELALPKVKETLIEVLTQGEARHLQLLFNGEAYKKGELLLEHGNRYDKWNAVSYGGLRALNATLTRGETPHNFPVPPGSILVEKVMNPMKLRYRFIDLLKPENEVLIPMLIALEPELSSTLFGFLKIYLKNQRKVPVPSGGRVSKAESYVAEVSEKEAQVSENTDETSTEATDEEALRKEIETYVRQVNQLMQEIEDLEFDGRIPGEMSKVGDGAVAWMKSVYSIIKARTSKKHRYRHLLNALKQHTISTSQTFSLAHEDDTYHAAAERMAGNNSGVLVFGHTHLPRFIPSGQSLYINTGTWCPTIELDNTIYFDDTDEDTAISLLETFVTDLQNNNLAPYRQLKTCFAHVAFDGESLDSAKLVEFQEDGDELVIGEWNRDN